MPSEMRASLAALCACLLLLAVAAASEPKSHEAEKRMLYWKRGAMMADEDDLEGRLDHEWFIHVPLISEALEDAEMRGRLSRMIGGPGRRMHKRMLYW